MTHERLTRWLGRADLEWILLSLWVALLGVQLPVEIPNFRFSPADIVLAALMVVLLVRRRHDLLSAAVARTPLHIALVLLLVALFWGSLVSLLRTGTLVREAALNKDVGFFVLAAIVLAIETLVRSAADIRAMLRVFLTAGTVVTWTAAFTTLLVPIATNGELGQRFVGFLLNPSANALFLAVLLMAQIGSAVGRRIVLWSQSAQVANTFGLTLLLVLTLSRSTWLATLIALALLVVLVLRDRPLLPVLVGLALLVVSAQPLVAALAPVVAQATSGRVGTFEREVAPASTPPPDLGLILAKSSAPNPSRTASGTPAPTPPPTHFPSPTTTHSSAAATPEPTLAPSVASRYVQDALLTAADRFGGTDRIAFNVVAFKLWLADPVTAAAGIGLDVFLQISPMVFGTPVIIHNTYLWLPVEMGIPGLAALIALVVTMCWVARGVGRSGLDRSIVVAIVGTILVFMIWIAENEGLYQRTLWMTLAIGSAAIAAQAAARTGRSD